MKLTKATKCPEGSRFEPWWIACISISYEVAVQILSEPHFTEKEPTRTAGGLEDHWCFEFPCGMRMGMLLRRPYEEMEIYADPPTVSAVTEYLKPLLNDREVRWVDPPILRI